MSDMTEEKKYWQINTEKLVQDIKEAARSSQTEEDLKMKVEPILQSVFKKIGVDIETVGYERTATSFKGRTDAVYGFLTIEYKAPNKNKLFGKAEINKAINQLQQYLSERATEFGIQKEDFLEKAIGVVIDGESILFVRFTKTPTLVQTPVPIKELPIDIFPEAEAQRGFQVLGPYLITPSSITNLLIYARASARLPLTAQNLAKVFGPHCPIASQAVYALYSSVMSTQRQQKSSRIKTFFNEWDRLFGVVYGQELQKAETALTEVKDSYQMSGGVRLKECLFAIHTYYAFLMKLIAIELVSLQRESTMESFIKGLDALSDKELKERLSYLESGADFIHHGIENFLEADFFSWYLDDWSDTMAKAFRGILREFNNFESATPILEPDWTRDLLQKLYEVIVPKQLRHSLGEYYTPDWLAGYVVDKSGYQGKICQRFLDPFCGSGTFLVQAIHRTINYAAGQKKVSVKVLARHILDNIVGFDLNPVAVLAARTNYLIAISKFIREISPISVPVYLCDTVCPPKPANNDGELDFDKTLVFTTTKGNYIFPITMQSKNQIDKFTSMITIALRGKLVPEQFEKQVKTEFNLPQKEISLLIDIYRSIKELDDKGENGIWARYIKNTFAPLYLGKFDYVIGNPPWIRWGYLSDDYRARTLKLWNEYKLFSLKGYAGRLGGGEKDFSMLCVYKCADKYLEDKGKLGFVITMEVFKSKGAGEGFRQFEIKNKHSIPLKVLSMENMVHLKPFADAANKTSIFFLKKGEPTTYPVPVIEWKRKPGCGKIHPEWSLDEVQKHCQTKKMQATPINPDKIVSTWQTALPKELKLYSKVKGKNPYKAYRGAATDPYGVFWLQVKEVRADGLLVIQNMHDRGDTEIKPIKTAIESTLVFPAISGGEIVKFGTTSNFYLLITQNPKTREPHSEDWMIKNVSSTYAYLKKFEDVLSARQSRTIKELGKKTAFYTMFGIGEYSFAKYRVVWQRMAQKISAVVLSSMKTGFGIKPIISTDTTALFAIDDKTEAHYLCAILNSDLINSFISSFSSAGRGFGAPSVMENLAIPQFNPCNKIHQLLTELSEKAHNLVKDNKPIDEIENRINSVVKQLWNIK
ncbi:MAG: N-6 DNA methylase [Planctomycetota bacterium]